MINLKQYKFTDEDDVWEIEEQISGTQEFKEDIYNRKGYVTFNIEMSSDIEGVDFEKPQAFQQKALNHFIDNQIKIFDSLCQGVIEHSHNLIKLYGSDNVPELKSILDVKQNISISAIHVLGEEIDGFSYLGFNCGCTWDEEHGLGIVMHKERCIDFGDAEIAFLSYDKILQDKMSEEEWRKYNDEREKQIAENVAKYEEEIEILKNEKESEKKVKMKWWQFWKK